MITRIKQYLSYRFEKSIVLHLYNRNSLYSKLIKYLLIKIFNWHNHKIEKADEVYQYFDNSNRTLFYTRKSRVIRYKNGIERKLNSLQQEYRTNNLILPEYSSIIDIGANIGEFSMFWEDRNFNVISFEPEELEFKALQRNLKSNDIYNFGLWHENCTLKFYHSNETGDSSFIKGNTNDNYSELLVKTLDSFSFYQEHTIGLIKLEAEGAEPEIIKGGIETFKRAHFVTCDVGLERGFNNSSTIVEVTSLLSNIGFEMIQFNPTRYITVFRNSNLTKDNIGSGLFSVE